MNAMRVPIIDITALEGRATLRALDCACREWGFFQITHHGIDASVLRGVLTAARQFFTLPEATKRAIERSAENPWGYYDRELTKNTRDWKQVFDYGPADGGVLQPQWPTGLPSFEPAVRAYYAACERLAVRLIDALNTNLAMPPRYLRSFFGAAQTSFARLNYYPACPEPAAPEGASTPNQGFLGVNHHTDAGALTLLLQDGVPGLEVFREGRWHLVEPRADTLVVNIGDVLQVWSNDRYQAPLHRALAPSGRERYSAPFFYNPSYATDYAPLLSVVDSRNPARYRPINWGEFRALRATGDYADHGEEVQIEHYVL